MKIKYFAQSLFVLVFGWIIYDAFYTFPPMVKEITDLDVYISGTVVSIVC
jgi:hypothetical protein